MFDELGDRMKAAEAAYRTSVPAGSWIVVRCDGRAFSSYTRRLDRPFDARLADDMAYTAEALAKEITGTVCAYTQSDEISVIATDTGSERAEHWFGGGVQKIVSAAAAFATATFATRRAEIGAPPGMFDARVFTLEPTELADYLWWRQSDARRNAVSMLCHHHLGKAAVVGVGTRARIGMLADAGVVLGDVESRFVNGQLAVRRPFTGDITYTDTRTGAEVTRTGVTYQRWVTGPAPLLRDAAAVAELLGLPGSPHLGPEAPV